MEELAAQLTAAFLEVLRAHPAISGGAVLQPSDLFPGILRVTTEEEKRSGREDKTREGDGGRSQGKRKEEKRSVEGKNAEEKKGRKRRRNRAKITQCRRCHQFGHIIKDCTTVGPLCGICADPHWTHSCIEKLKQGQVIRRKCALCGAEGHSAPSYRCPERLKLGRKEKQEVPKTTAVAPSTEEASCQTDEKEAPKTSAAASSTHDACCQTDDSFFLHVDLAPHLLDPTTESFHSEELRKYITMHNDLQQNKFVILKARPLERLHTLLDSDQYQDMQSFYHRKQKELELQSTIDALKVQAKNNEVLPLHPAFRHIRADIYRVKVYGRNVTLYNRPKWHSEGTWLVQIMEDGKLEDILFTEDSLES